MASKTAQTMYRRKLRRSNAGRARKNALANRGTTVSFPLHTPEADANAPAEARKTG